MLFMIELPLIALPPQMRSQYTQHLLDITKQAPQLLISLEYDQNSLKGPPFSVPEHELTEHYATHYQIKLLETITENLKGKVSPMKMFGLWANHHK